MKAAFKKDILDYIDSTQQLLTGLKKEAQQRDVELNKTQEQLIKDNSKAHSILEKCAKAGFINIKENTNNNGVLDLIEAAVTTCIQKEANLNRRIPKLGEGVTESLGTSNLTADDIFKKSLGL